MKDTKVCGCCDRILPVTEFWAHTRHADGRQPFCIDCMNVSKYRNEYRQHNTVYAIRNRLTAERYVGQTTQDPKRRLSEHLSCARKNKGNSRLYDAMRVFVGRQHWELEILEQYPYGTLTSEELRGREQFYIETLQPVFNTNNAIRTES